MTGRTIPRVTGLWIALAIACHSGCDGIGGIGTVDALADALAAKGLAFNVKEPLEVRPMESGTIDEAIVLKGKGLIVELYRIEDEKTFKMFRGSQGIADLAERLKARTLPTKSGVHSKMPFVIVVKLEPADDPVERALDRVLPGAVRR